MIFKCIIIYNLFYFVYLFSEDKTLSIWVDVFAPNEKEKYTNPSYRPRNTVITPKYTLASLELWKECYMRYIYH